MITDALRERAQKIKMIVCDMDGTLLDENGKLTPETLRAADFARERGIYITIASGRTYTMLSAFIEPLGIKGPVITGNGTQIIDSRTDAVLTEHLLDHAEAVKMLRFCRERRLDCTAFSNELCAIFDYSDRLSVFEQYSRREVAAGRKPVEITYYTDDFSNIADKKIAKLLVQARGDDEVRLATAFAKTLNVEVCSSSPVLVEIYNPVADKGLGLVEAARALSLAPEQVCALGDYDNDIPMFKTAGLVVAMGNALPHIKAMAHYVTDSNASDGAAKAIYKLFG